MKTLIVSNGYIENPERIKGLLPHVDFIISCDGGTKYLEYLGLIPDIILGDFDSIDPLLLNKYRDMGISIRSYPKHKDQTDTHIAVDVAVEAGADEILLTGVLGSRWDHSYANVMLLAYLCKQGIRAEIIDCHNLIKVTNKSFEIEGQPGDILSLLPFGGECTVESTKGLEYEIRDKILPFDFPLGVSNVFTEKKAKVIIKTGWLMVVKAQD